MRNPVRRKRIWLVSDQRSPEMAIFHEIFIYNNDNQRCAEICVLDFFLGISLATIIKQAD